MVKEVQSEGYKDKQEFTGPPLQQKGYKEKQEFIGLPLPVKRNDLCKRVMSISLGDLAVVRSATALIFEQYYLTNFTLENTLLINNI